MRFSRMDANDQTRTSPLFSINLGLTSRDAGGGAIHRIKCGLFTRLFKM
jgi:hypothetical protein